ncbi:MAG: substrate-binding domain-containing protein [Solirubrobacterales bacterium]|nr:substrate-binding domain-containing protein [Solirubrobacterales bacterium]
MALCGTAVGASGCGSADSPTHTASASGGGPGAAHARAVVAKLEQPTTSFGAPGPPLTNAKSLAGKSVWYVPISISVPVFAIADESLRTALGKLGIQLHTCSGEANPSATAACLEHAVSSGAGGIIADGIPVALAPNAFAAAESHHIPVLVVDQEPPAASAPGAVRGKGDDRLAYALLQNHALVTSEADWITANSGGSASVLSMPFTDSPSTLQWGAEGVAELHRYCPACTVTTQRIGLADLTLAPSQTSSALLSHPGVTYVMPEFDAALQGVEQGIQQSGMAQKVAVVTSAGDLPALQMVSAHRVSADVGQDFPYEGWADADEMLRMMLHAPIVEEHVPLRIFTAADVGEVKLTTAAQASGEWYGSSSYTTMFEKLWGAS